MIRKTLRRIQNIQFDENSCGGIDIVPMAWTWGRDEVKSFFSHLLCRNA
jgi:hypothetical protein